MNDLVAADRGIEVRYPFLDRRLVELVLSLPETHVLWDGEHRGLHRRAFGARLPPSVVARSDKADLSRPYLRKLRASVDRDRAAGARRPGPRVDAGALLATYDTGGAEFARRSGRPGAFDLWAALSAGAALMAC